MTSISEKILLYRVQVQRDPDAFAQLYDSYVTQIYRFVYFKVGGHEEAEDLTAEVFLKAWNYIREKQEVKSFSGLLYRIARNCIIDLYRAKSVRPEIMMGEAELEVSDRGAWYEKLTIQVEHEQAISALKRLKEEYREILTLRFIDQLEIPEIAEITQKGAVTVRVTLHRALKKFKEILEQNR